MPSPLINGREYSWADITVNIGGVPIIGITAIEYDESEVKEDNWGAGTLPISRGYGNEKVENPSVTIYASEVEALMDRAPQGKLTKFGVFEVIVQMMVGTSIKTHILKNCEFLRNMRRWEQGQTKQEVTLPLIVSHVIWKKN